MVLWAKRMWGKGRMLTLVIASVLLFGLLAVGVQAGIITTKDINFGKSAQQRAEFQQYNIDNISYDFSCTNEQCLIVLNKANVFQDRRITFDATYQYLVKEEVEAVYNETDGSTITEGEPAVYETRSYTTLELEQIAQDKINQELGSALQHFKDLSTPKVSENKKLENKGKVKV